MDILTVLSSSGLWFWGKLKSELLVLDESQLSYVFGIFSSGVNE